MDCDVDTTFETHFTIKDLEKQWGLGRETIRRMIQNEAGIVRVRMGDRKENATYRIPASVARRIHLELTHSA